MKRPKKFLTITVTGEGYLRVKNMVLSCNKLLNCAGGKDGRESRWFSIPIDDIKKLLAKELKNENKDKRGRDGL